MKTMYRLFIVLMLVSATAFAADKGTEVDRVQKAKEVLDDVLHVPESIPQSLLDKAKCVVIMPSVVKGAFIVGASYGKGVMVCRTSPDFTGAWGAPAMYQLEGGSVGFQIGGQATDFVLLVMNDHGVNSLLNSKVKLGADVSVAAGPVGRAAEADTDAYLRAEILTYSRSRGLFAGVSLEGASLRPDDSANNSLYGEKVTTRDIIAGRVSNKPEAGHALDAVLDHASPHSS